MNLPPPLMLLVALAVTACGEEDRTPTRYTPSAGRQATVSDDTTPPLVTISSAPVAPPGAPPANVRLTARLSPTKLAGGSDPAGTSSVSDAGTQTRVDVALSGVLPNEHYDGAVRRGACGDVGAFVSSLNPVSTGEAGSGRASTFTPVHLARLLEAPHVLVYGRNGQVELCGGLGERDAG